jgi:hypothetical protein
MHTIVTPLASLILASFVVVPGAGAAPALEVDRIIRTTPFVNSTVRMTDGEGMAFVGVNDTLWLADDNAETLYEVNRSSGVLLSTIGPSALAQAVQLGGTERAGLERPEDIEAVAYDSVNDTLYVLSGNCCPAPPAVFRLVRNSVTEAFEVETFQPLDPAADFSGAAWHPTEQRLYVSQAGQVKPYDYATNTIGAPVATDSRIQGAIVGLGFSADGHDLWLVTTADVLYRVDWRTKQLVEGYVFDLLAHDIQDARAVEVIDGQLYVLDGFALDGTDPRRFAVTVFNIVEPQLAASFTSPAANAAVSGTTSVGMASSGGATGSRTFRLELLTGSTTTLLTRQTVSGTSLTFSWNTTPAPDGSASLRLTVTDSAGATASATRTVTIANGTTATFTASISYPGAGAVIKGNQTVGMSTTAPWGQTKRFVLSVGNQVIVDQSLTGTTLWISWNSRTTPDGPQTLTLRVTHNGATASATRNVTVANGTTPASLTASFTSPAANAAVSGTTSVGMASSGGATGSRTLRLELLTGSTTTLLTQQPVSGTSLTFSWNTTTAPDGSASLRLVVTDSAGATATATRTVTIANSTTTPSFAASITYPGEGATVGGNQTVGMSTTGPWGKTKTFTLSVGDQVIVSQTTTGTTLWISWNTRTTPDGGQTLTFRVTFNGVTATATRNVTVRN